MIHTIKKKKQMQGQQISSYRGVIIEELSRLISLKKSSACRNLTRILRIPQTFQQVKDTKEIFSGLVRK